MQLKRKENHYSLLYNNNTAHYWFNNGDYDSLYVGAEEVEYLLTCSVSNFLSRASTYF